MNTRRVLSRTKRLVVKVGTTQITDNGLVSRPRIEALALALVELRKRNIEVLLVTSGAVSAGIAVVGLQAKKGLSIPYKQAAAAIGQTSLMQLYAEVFASHGLPCGQVLLTRDVMQNRERYMNASNTLLTLLKLGALPVINENDTMVVDEIKVGDNDRLAAMVAELVDADLLVLLSDVDGFYENWADPERRRRVPHIQAVTKAVRAEAAAEGSKYSTGGMKTKLDAAEMCAARGIHMVLASGADPAILTTIIEGADVGTFFEAGQPGMRGRKHWLLHHLAPRGQLVVDDGARSAIIQRGKSLLPGGISEVHGNFAAGDGVEIIGRDGAPIARGITNYGREDLVKIAGKKTSEIATILGAAPYEEVVHRDNLARI